MPSTETTTESDTEPSSETTTESDTTPNDPDSTPTDADTEPDSTPTDADSTTTEPETEPTTTDSPSDTDTDSPAETSTTIEPETDSSDDSEDPKTEDPTSPVEKECSKNTYEGKVFMYDPDTSEFYYTESITVKNVDWNVKIRFTTSECSETTPEKETGNDVTTDEGTGSDITTDEETGSDVTTDEATIVFKDKLLCVTESSIQEARRINEKINLDGCFKIDALSEKLSEAEKTNIENVITTKARLVSGCGSSTKNTDCGKVNPDDIYDVDMSGMILPSLLSLLTLILLL